jgi:hypothetical protein
MLWNAIAKFNKALPTFLSVSCFPIVEKVAQVAIKAMSKKAKRTILAGASCVSSLAYNYFVFPAPLSYFPIYRYKELGFTTSK